jgi:hypothetical protein
MCDQWRKWWYDPLFKNVYQVMSLIIQNMLTNDQVSILKKKTTNKTPLNTILTF